MKTNYIIAVLLLCIITVAVACTKGGHLDTVNGDVYAVTGNAGSKQLVPAIDTISTGTFTGRYDVLARNFTCTIGWDSLWAASKKDTLTGISFFAPAAVGANGPLIKTVRLINNNLRGTITIGLAGHTQLNDEQYASLLQGKMYYVITTAKFPNGIIRGQLTAQKTN